MGFLSFLSQPAASSRFIDGSFLIAGLPLASDNAQKYAWVTDLHDGQPDLVISDGTNWKPVRPLAARVLTNSDSAWTYRALVNSPTQILKGAITLQRDITLSSQYAYSGARVRFKREATGLLGIRLVGLLTASLGLNSWADMEYSANDGGWVQTASGGLL